MTFLLLTAILAFGVNSVFSEREVIGSRRCTSTQNLFTGYSTVRCLIHDTVITQAVYVSISSVRYPYTCSKSNYDIVIYKEQTWIKVRNGCDGYFVVSIEKENSEDSNNGEDGNNREDSKVNKDSKNTKVSNPDGCGVANSASGFRVVGGKTAGRCQYPWMVMVYNTVKRTYCGGSILDEKHILTAAHCVEDQDTSKVYPTSHFVIYSGTSKISSSSATRQRHTAKSIIAHKNYVFTGYHVQDDIAVITITNTFKPDYCHRPICLSDGSKIPQNLDDCRVMGWGRTSNTETIFRQDMQWAFEKAVSKRNCYRLYQNSVTDKVFCAKGANAGACSGDSGGPFTCKHRDGKFYQYGIVSVGKPDSCGLLYTLYVRVDSYRDWINTAISSSP